MRKILIAVDGSKNSFKAVDYISRQFSGISDLQITLLHVLPYPPAPLWDDGHIPTTEEKKVRDEAIDRWLTNQGSKSENIFSEAKKILAGRGISTRQIETKAISDSIDTAESIMEEAKGGSYETLVLGRRGLSPVKRFLMGSVTSKIINHGAGMTICVVE